MPILYVVIMAGLHGAWFDIEEWIERPEYAEIYMYQDWQYVTFYIVMIVIILLQCTFICLYILKRKPFPLFQLLIIYIVAFIWIAITAFFILLMPELYHKPIAWLNELPSEQMSLK